MVELLHNAETLHNGLIDADPIGLAWYEGTPLDWSDDRLLAANEVLYGDGHMVNHNQRRYAGQCAPHTEPNVGTTPSEPADQPATAVADAPSPGLDIDPFAVRVNELMAESWACWNAEARARTEMWL